jgi:uncharacterized radical SAM superfamily protein
MKLLILFPNATTTATVSTAVPILAGIAKHRKWELNYFDTYVYTKEGEQEAALGKAKTGGFKQGVDLPFGHKDSSSLITDLQNKIDDLKPDLIAVTCLSPEYNYLMTFWDKVFIPKKTIVVIGGIHATLMGNKVAKTRLFDLVALGEGEETFNEILHRLEVGYSIDQIQGTYYVDRIEKKIIENPLRLLLPAEKLWEIERDFSFFNEDFFLRPFDGKKIRRNEIEIARGCPYHCAYCGNRSLKEFNRGLGKYVKARSIKSSIDQMKILVEKYGIDIFSFMDECFLSHSESWLKEFMDAYKLEINKPYLFMTRAETINEKKVKLLLSYDIPFQPAIGVESGSDRILKEVCERSCTVDKIIPAFDILNKHKIRTNTFFIVGFPFETRSDAFKSMELCKRIKPSVSSVSIFQPYPGQKLTNVCLDMGFITENEAAGTFASDSVLDMPEPYLGKKEITNLWRVFMLYAMLPKEYHSDIEKCEKDFENNQELFDKLVKLRWEIADWGKIKGDIKLV